MVSLNRVLTIYLAGADTVCRIYPSDRVFIRLIF